MTASPQIKWSDQIDGPEFMGFPMLVRRREAEEKIDRLVVAAAVVLDLAERHNGGIARVPFDALDRLNDAIEATR